jgi:hypothetical protein
LQFEVGGPQHVEFAGDGVLAGTAGTRLGAFSLSQPFILG